jgi:hypothetical protein
VLLYQFTCCVTVPVHLLCYCTSSPVVLLYQFTCCFTVPVHLLCYCTSSPVVLLYKFTCCFTVPVHLLYFTVAPGFNTMVSLFYSPIIYSLYDRFCFTMLFTYCVTLVVINCGLHPLLYILEAIHSCLSFQLLTRTKTLPEDGT